MDKKIWLIRHGESTANAGIAAEDHRTVALTEIGWQQAKAVSLLITEPPTLIITSPFTRTQITAEPTLKRFPNARHEVWDVQEFTYLAPATCAGTIAADRRERVNEYWQRLDPDYLDGQGAESFAMLLSRAKTAIDRIDRLESGFIVMFTHAQFIRAMQLLKDNSEQDINCLMRQFRALPRYGNCEVVRWEK